jgi:pantoate--beta-alanine ligase
MSAVQVSSHAELLAARSRADRARDSRSAVVMTMGALHEGHAELIRQARATVGDDGLVIVTDFVNPTQFAPGEDFDRYPRTLDDDVAVCSAAGADLVFAPSVDEVYGHGSQAAAVTVDPGPLGDALEGTVRPGHFRGVLTVVAKLLHLTSPDLALFGEKDYQQLVLISAMVQQLRFPVLVVPVATVRESDGLAMSSRNRFLSAAERNLAARVPQALAAAVAAAEVGGAQAGIDAGLSILSAHDGIEVDYLTITSPALGTVEPGPARALIAVRVGSTRLIDNMACTVGITC